MEQLDIFGIMYDKYILKNINLIELFAGYGSQALALKYLGVKFNHHKIVEWATKSIQAYNEIHFQDNTDYSKEMTDADVLEFLVDKGISMDYNQPMTREQIKRRGIEWQRKVYNDIIATHNLVDISRVHASDLEMRKEQDYIMTYSFPCFTKDSMVLTKKGYKNIENIDIGDMVLSHDNKYHKVINKFNNGTHEIYKINAMSIDEIKTTYNHKFYIRTKYRKGHKNIRCFGDPIWKETKDLTKNDYLGIAINQENKICQFKTLPTDNKNFWWVIGRYLGDGWQRTTSGIIICCAKNELEEITEKLDLLHFNYCISEEKSIYKIHLSKKVYSDFVEQFGKGASNKHLTQTIFDLPCELLKSFIEGYLSADGCKINDIYKANSVSRELIYGMAQCVAKVYHTPYRIYKVSPPSTKIIENRLVNQKQWYQLVFKKEKKKQDKAFYENGYIWYPIKSIEHIGKDEVFDIEVENSHSFTIQNTIVHNCQDLSLAGLRNGMSRDSGTRSGLLWQVERILLECKETGIMPRVLLMENVPEVCGSNNQVAFNDWCSQLTKLGYHNTLAILNAKDYGIPQNRRRCFMVSIYGEYAYSMPEEIKLQYKLKDLLENNVAEKYFLSGKQISEIQKWNAYEKPLENMENIDRNNISPTLTTRTSAYAASMILVKEISNYVGTYQYAKSDNFMKGKDRLQEGKEVADTLQTSGKEGVVIKVDNYLSHEKENVKQELCNKLVKKGLVKENDVIRHSYTHNRLDNGVENMGRVQSKDNNIMPTLDTRSDCFGVVVKELIPYGSYYTWKDNQGNINTQCNRAVDENGVALTVACAETGKVLTNNLRIRKLTPRECMRLMGVKDSDSCKIKQSDASIYHLAGDSIVTTCLMAIFGELLGIDYQSKIREFIKEIIDG